MIQPTQALIDLAFAAVDWHETLRRRRMEHLCPQEFAGAVAAFKKVLEEPTEREMILYALDRAGAPREPGVNYPVRLPPYEVETFAPSLYRVRMNGREFYCEHTASGWRITQRQ